MLPPKICVLRILAPGNHLKQDTFWKHFLIYLYISARLNGLFARIQKILLHHSVLQKSHWFIRFKATYQKNYVTKKYTFWDNFWAFGWLELACLNKKFTYSKLLATTFSAKQHGNGGFHRVGSERVGHHATSMASSVSASNLLLMMLEHKVLLLYFLLLLYIVHLII